MSNGKAIIILLTVRLMKKILLYKTSYFQEPHTYSKKNNRNWIRFSKLCSKIWLKNAIGADKSKFAIKADLASLKSDIDKLYIDKLEKVPSGLSSLKVNSID